MEGSNTLATQWLLKTIENHNEKYHHLGQSNEIANKKLAELDEKLEHAWNNHSLLSKRYESSTKTNDETIRELTQNVELLLAKERQHGATINELRGKVDELSKYYVEAEYNKSRREYAKRWAISTIKSAVCAFCLFITILIFIKPEMRAIFFKMFVGE